MGARGPKPKTMESRALSGVRARRPGGGKPGELPENMPRKPDGPVVPPEFVSAAERVYFDEIVDHLTKMRIVWPSDAIAIGMLAGLMHQYVELKRLVLSSPTSQRYKAVIGKDVSTNQLVNAFRRYQIADLQTLHKMIMTELDRLGMTPTARTKTRIFSIGSPMVAVGGAVPVPRGVRKSASTAAGFMDLVQVSHDARLGGDHGEYEPAAAWLQQAGQEAQDRTQPAATSSSPVSSSGGGPAPL
jgi:hypothetical protein